LAKIKAGARKSVTSAPNPGCLWGTWVDEMALDDMTRPFS
jgi:hypothetical protein